jgi:hypothetical protein
MMGKLGLVVLVFMSYAARCQVNSTGSVLVFYSTKDDLVVAADSRAIDSDGKTVGNPVEGERDSVVKANTIPL